MSDDKEIASAVKTQDTEDDTSTSQPAAKEESKTEDPVETPSEPAVELETKEEPVESTPEPTAEPAAETKVAVEQLTEGAEKLDIKDEPKTDETVESLFPDSGPSFMESIEKSKHDEELAQLKEENEALKKSNSELTEKLSQLTKENKDLKFLKMDHVDQIETLEAQITDLQSKLAKAKVDGPTQSQQQQNLQTPYDFDENVSLSPSPSFAAQPNFPSTFSQFNLGRNESTQSLGEVKARLNKWKGWNLDMTSWRTVGSGPIVEL